MLRQPDESWGEWARRLHRNDTVRAIVTIVGLAIFIYILPQWSLFSPIFRITQLTNLAGLAIIAIGLNLLTGYNGQISLGHSGIALAGAYAMGIAITIGIAGVELHPILAVLFAGAVGAAIGILIGIPALRLTGPYLAIATLALAIAMPIILKWNQISDVTGGATGIQLGINSLPPEFLEDFVGGTPEEQAARWRYYVVAFPALIMGIIAWNLTRTRIGRAWVAIRDSEVGAQQMGINVGFYKTLAFSISSAYAAIGGALITYSNLSFISPESFTLLDSIAYLTAIVVGGLATVPGAALGAAFITFQEEIIDWTLADEWTFAIGSHMLFAIPSPLSYIFGLIQNEWRWEPWPNPEPAGNIQDLRLPIYGLILILVMTFMPYGFWGFFKRIAGWRPWKEYGRYRESGSAGAYFDQRLRQPVLDRLGRNRGTWSAQTPVSPDPPLRPEEEP
ncbi:MAG TPA: branched-chain amino acid ABC transporter permease [Dehalococcoidia bacterium]|nr:branched-chain amino acid ABC transporter permease [Dehalococcoidia bacterium]